MKQEGPVEAVGAVVAFPLVCGGITNSRDGSFWALAVSCRAVPCRAVSCRDRGIRVTCRPLVSVADGTWAGEFTLSLMSHDSSVSHMSIGLMAKRFDTYLDEISLGYTRNLRPTVFHLLIWLPRGLAMS